jgi:hypothetical protein
MTKLLQRFYEKVLIGGYGPRGHCWEWRASLDGRGYGQIRVDRKTKRAHRLSYELLVGPIPEGLFVCHQCDNPRCVNPYHLFLGTAKDNSMDMARKGRQGFQSNPNKIRRGSKHGRAKLTEQQVLAIREAWSLGSSTMQQLANDFNVSSSTIDYIVNKKGWM